jgi:hypothetical protein
MAPPTVFFSIVLLATNLSGETSLSIGSQPGFPAFPVTLQVMLKSPTNVAAAQFDLSYNPNKVIAGQIELFQALSNHVMRSYDLAPGVRRVLIYSPSNTIITNRQLARATFAVAAQERSSSGPISPAEAILAQNDGVAVLPLTINAGSIFVTPVHLGDDGTADLFLQVSNDQRYIIQASTNLQHWIPISTNSPVGDYLQHNDPDARNYQHRFYKAVAE